MSFCINATFDRIGRFEEASAKLRLLRSQPPILSLLNLIEQANGFIISAGASKNALRTALLQVSWNHKERPKAKRSKTSSGRQEDVRNT